MSTGAELLGLTPEQADGWHAFFRRGEVFVAVVDRARVSRHLRWNTGLLVAVALALAGCVALCAALVAADLGRPVTFVLIGIFMLSLVLMAVRVLLARRRLLVSRASADDYLVVSAEGVRVAGVVDLPWNEVGIALGFDGRGRPISGIRRPGAFLSAKSGVSEAELWLAHERARALRDGLPPAFRRLFEVITEHGAVRIPLDTVVAPDEVRRCLAAVYVAATDAGTSVTLSNDRTTISQTTTKMMKTSEMLAESFSPKKGERRD